MRVKYTTVQLEAAADALRRFEQSGKQLNAWDRLPAATRNKWRDKVDVVINAMEESAPNDSHDGPGQ